MATAGFGCVGEPGAGQRGADHVHHAPLIQIPAGYALVPLQQLAAPQPPFPYWPPPAVFSRIHPSVDQTVKDPKLVPPLFVAGFALETDVQRLKKAWPRVEAYLTDNGLKYVLQLDTGFVAVCKSSGEKAQDAKTRMAKARHLCHLITHANLHPSLALEIIKCHRKHIWFLIGTSKGGLCSVYAINHDDYLKRRKCVIDSKKAIYDLTCCTIHVTGDLVVAVGDDSFNLAVAKNVVEFCIIWGFHPLSIIEAMAVEKSENYRRALTCWRIDFEGLFSRLLKGEVEQHDNYKPRDELLDGPYTRSYHIDKETVTKCEEYRHEVESCLQKHGITWTLDPDQDLLKVSTTSKEPGVTDKASFILTLLARTDLPPPEAIRRMNDNQQLLCIQMGTGWGGRGLRSHFNMPEEEYVKRRERLKGSLKAIDELTQCHTHIHGDTAFCVGTSDGLEMVRIFVEACIVHNVNPAQFTLMIKPNELESSPEGDGMSGPVSSYTESFHESDEGKLQDAWPIVESSLKELGISCKLNVDERIMTVSTTEETRDPSGIFKARHLLELLATTSLPASLAVELMNGLREHVFMKIGTREGGLCSKFGISQAEFMKRGDRLKASLQEIICLASCDNIYISEDTVTIVGTCGSPRKVKTLVEAYIVHDVELAILRNCKERSVAETRKRKREVQLRVLEKRMKI